MKEFLQKAWSDIKRRENLELYIILLAIILVFSADVLGIDTFSALTEVILAALAALIYVLIRSQHNSERIEKKIDSIINANLSTRDFLQFNPNEFRNRLGVAKDFSILTISGAHSLLHINRQALIDFFERGGRLRLTLIDPDSTAFRMALERLAGDKKVNEREMNNEVTATLGSLKKIMRKPDSQNRYKLGLQN